MGKGTLIKAAPKTEGIDLDISTLIKDFLSFPLSSESRQVIHKLNRILVEIEYASNNREKYTSLTAREKEIIILVASGYNNPQISNKLFISRCTVEQHRKNINRKLEINTIYDLCVFAYAFNLV